MLPPVRKTFVFTESPFPRPSGTFTAPNPPAGTAIPVYVNEAMKDKLGVTIADADGKLIRTLPVPSGPGVHRIQWDMRTGTGRTQAFVKEGKYTATLVKTHQDKPVTVGEARTVELVKLD